MSTRNQIGTERSYRSGASPAVFLPTKVARWGTLAPAAIGLSIAAPVMAKDQWEREVTHEGKTYKVGIRENGDGFIRKGFLKLFETDEIFTAIEIVERETGCRVTRHIVMGFAHNPHQVRAKLDCDEQ